jgi:hypothetical protein
MERLVTPGSNKPSVTLILGSGPDAMDAAAFPRDAFTSIVAINNAWQVRSDWDYLIHPEDFPAERHPPNFDSDTQTVVTAADYVAVQNAFGGFVYAGGTMAYTAGYWALGVLKPDVLAFFGCDMNYDKSRTHFYGKGTADPLRDDITLQSLEAKSARLMFFAAAEGCLTVNLSAQKQSRLVFPNHQFAQVDQWDKLDAARQLSRLGQSIDQGKANEALGREAELGYMAVSGRYWEELDRFDADELRKLDALWLAAANH